MHAVELKCLQGMPLFRDVALAKLKLVAMTGRRLTYQAGEVIAGIGTTPGAVFIVLMGEIDIQRPSHGTMVSVAKFGEGYVIGDISVLLGEPYLATFVAETPVTVLSLDADTFMQLVRDVPELSMALMRDLGRRVITLSQMYADDHR